MQLRHEAPCSQRVLEDFDAEPIPTCKLLARQVASRTRIDVNVDRSRDLHRFDALVSRWTSRAARVRPELRAGVFRRTRSRAPSTAFYSPPRNQGTVRQAAPRPPLSRTRPCRENARVLCQGVEVTCASNHRSGPEAGYV